MRRWTRTVLRNQTLRKQDGSIAGRFGAPANLVPQVDFRGTETDPLGMSCSNREVMMVSKFVCKTDLTSRVLTVGTDAQV
jgi:hypothetical protein